MVRRQFLCAKTHQNYKNKTIDCDFRCGHGPGRVPGPGLRGSWPRPASGRIRADRSFLVARPGSHLELMAWPDGRLIAKAGAIFGAPVAICCCFFAVSSCFFCSGSFLNCAFFCACPVLFLVLWRAKWLVLILRFAGAFFARVVF